MQKSKEEVLNVINDITHINECLCPDLFDDNNVLLPKIYEKLSNTHKFVTDMVFPFFTKVKILDIVVTGSLCSYTWNSKSDLDIFIVIDDITPEHQFLSARIFDNISMFLLKQSWKPYIKGHPIDISIMPAEKYKGFYKHEINKNKIETYAYANYSLLTNEWKSKPLKTTYPFSAEELYNEFVKLSDSLKSFTDGLEKTPNGFLTKESQNRLLSHTATIKKEAFLSKEFDDLHEYNLQYNTYRLAKKLKLFAPYHKYAIDSSKNMTGGQ